MTNVEKAIGRNRSRYRSKRDEAKCGRIGHRSLFIEYSTIPHLPAGWSLALSNKKSIPALTILPWFTSQRFPDGRSLYQGVVRRNYVGIGTSIVLTQPPQTQYSPVKAITSSMLLSLLNKKQSNLDKVFPRV